MFRCDGGGGMVGGGKFSRGKVVGAVDGGEKVGSGALGAAAKRAAGPPADVRGVER